MKTAQSIHRGTRLGHLAAVLAAVPALALPGHAGAAEVAAANIVQVKVLPDHYALDQQRFADLAALEAALPRDARAVMRLDHCGARSVAPLLAAVERLQRGGQLGVLEIRALPSGEPACAGAAAAGGAYLETDASGRSLIP